MFSNQNQSNQTDKVSHNNYIAIYVFKYRPKACLHFTHKLLSDADRWAHQRSVDVGVLLLDDADMKIMKKLYWLLDFYRCVFKLNLGGN